MLDISYGQHTDPGNRRWNEDTTGVFVPRFGREMQDRGWLFALADGVGGLQSGEMASSNAVQVVVDGFASAGEQTLLTSLLPRLIQHANAAVRDAGLRRNRRMATTLVACALRGDQAYLAHVGDSRCYLVRNGRAELLTHDHTWFSEQFRQGLISEAEAAASKSRHILTRTLGVERYVTADSTALTIRPDDVLVLCSDGLYAPLGAEKMADVVAHKRHDAAAIARDLVSEAIATDGSDNATAVVICIRSVEAVAMYRGRPYQRPG